LLDQHGNELFEFANELMHLHTTFVAKKVSNKKEIFRVKEKIFTFHDDMTVCVPSFLPLSCACTMLTLAAANCGTRRRAVKRRSSYAATGWTGGQRQVALSHREMSADFDQIRLGRDGPLLASTTRNWWTAKEFLVGASTYAIHVAPGGWLLSPCLNMEASTDYVWCS
jgi:hypothetical protein